jgi:phenylacetate-CoA ligase
MGRIKGRVDDMLIIRGVNLYPAQVEAAPLQLPELTPNIESWSAARSTRRRSRSR